MMTEAEMRCHRCCFSGHRPQKLTKPEGVILRDLEYAIRIAIQDGYTTFITGMACGVDIWAGEIVVRLKSQYPNLRLIAAVPFRGFESRWSEDWKNRYNALLGKADLVRFVCNGYSASAYQLRNEWMVDRSTRVIAVYNINTSSGTKNTVDYAWKKAVPVVVMAG